MVKFDLSQFGTGSTVKSAKLELYVEAQPRSGNATANLYAVSKAWKEMEATWFRASSSSRWSKEGGDFDSKIEASFDFPSSATNKWQEFDVTSLVQEFVKNPETNLGFFLFMSVAMVTLEYVSSESNKTTNRPKLTLDIDNVGISNNNAQKSDQIRLSKISDSYFMLLPCSGQSQIKIFDLRGKVLSSFSLQKSNQWQKLPAEIVPGMHIVHINNRSRNFIKKVWFVK